MMRWAVAKCMIIYMLTIHDAQAMSISNTNLSTTSPYSTSTPPHTTTTPPYTTTTPYTTTPPPTTPSNLCYVFGSYYPRNSTIAEDYDADSNICAYVGVDENCNEIQRYQQNCRPTTTPQHCVYGEHVLRINERIGIDQYTIYCTEDGLEIVDHTEHRYYGCHLDGKFYSYDTSFITDSRGCAGIICKYLHTWEPWDNCPTTTTTTTQSVTTTPNIKPNTTTPLTTTTPSPLCQYNGQTLDIGESLPTDDRWCSGVTCTENGIIMVWDYFNCTTTTTPEVLTTTPTTATRTITPAMTTNNPIKIKKEKLKEKMKEKMNNKLKNLMKMKANRKMTRNEFLKLKRKMKIRMKKKLTEKVKKMKKKQKKNKNKKKNNNKSKNVMSNKAKKSVKFNV